MNTDAGMEDVYELTPVQQGMLFHTLAEPSSGIYIEQSSFVVRGELDPDLLCRCWQDAVMRHAVLRTSFYWEDFGKPLQVVHRAAQLSCQRLDWRDRREAVIPELREAVLREQRAPFDLEIPPLMRLAIACERADRHSIFWSHHHILLDGWSVASLLEEVIGSYDALRRGRAFVPLERVPFRDYVSWLQHQHDKRAEEFWRRHLAGYETPSLLSSCIPRSSTSSAPAIRAVTRSLTVEGTRRFLDWARTAQVTPNATVQAAWALLTSRYTRLSDVAFGMVVAGRPAELPGCEAMLGLCINTIPLRVTIEPDQPIATWVQKLQLDAARSREFEQLSLVRIHACSEVETGVTLFDTILMYHNFPDDPRWKRDLADLQISDTTATTHTNYSFTLVVESDEQLRFRALYDGSRYEGRDVERLVEGWVRLVERLAGGEVERVGEWRLEGERKEESGYGQGSGVERLEGKFEEWAEREPGREAVLWSGRRVSYGELNARANEVARRLRARGIGVEDRVGVCVERSVGMVVSLLGVLKSGAAYVPLDAEYPAERLRWMVEDAAPLVMLSTGGVEGKLRGSGVGEGVEWIRVDEDGGVEGAGDEGLGGEEEERAETRRGCGESLAYVMYTSGSTGRPKGVGISHRSASALVEWALGEYRAEELSGVLAGTSICFDLSVYELFVPLSGGGRVIVAENVLGVGEVEERGEVTLVNSVPSAVQELLNQGRLPAGVRTVNLAGEPLRAGLVDRLYGESGIERVVDLYGPTEDTVYSTRAERSAGGDETIGSPIAGTQAYVMDGYGDPLPIGVVGELYLGGAGLARGYVNRAGATAAAFVPDAWGPRAGGRLYRTGDLARWREDGTLEYLGRADHQVKIRGYRIELSEIETILCQHPDVHEAAVLSENDAVGRTRLVAYYVERTPLSTLQLRRVVKQWLPDFMVPSRFVRLERLPRTSSGKLDRKALHSLEPRQGEAPASASPQTEVEKVLAEVWCKELGLEGVRVNDSFVDLGGHSLQALAVLDQIRVRLGVRLKPRDLLLQTLGQIAVLVESLHATKGLRGE